MTISSISTPAFLPPETSTIGQTPEHIALARAQAQAAAQPSSDSTKPGGCRDGSCGNNIDIIA